MLFRSNLFFPASSRFFLDTLNMYSCICVYAMDIRTSRAGGWVCAFVNSKVGSYVRLEMAGSYLTFHHLPLSNPRLPNGCSRYGTIFPIKPSCQEFLSCCQLDQSVIKASGFARLPALYLQGRLVHLIH